MVRTKVLLLVAVLVGPSAFGYWPGWREWSWTRVPDVTGLRNGDFNRDGLPDLLVRKAGGLYVMLTESKGVADEVSLGSPAAIYAGSSISDAIVTDLNGDGLLDVVASDATTNTLIVLPGKGDGTFDAPRTTSLSFPPRQLIAADFNGDGRPDILVRTSPDRSFTIYHGGTGSQSFQLTQSATTPLTAGAYRVVAGDLEGDGKTDLVFACQTPLGYQVFFGKGNDTFESPITTASGPAIASDMTLADLDGDGRPEIVSSEFDSNTVTVVRNLGNRTFSAPSSTDVHVKDATGTHSNPAAVAVLDATDDGRPDVVALLPNDAGGTYGAICTLPGNGDTTFGKPVLFETGLLYVADVMTTADFTGDGRTDVVTWSAYTVTYWITLLRNLPNGTPVHRAVRH